MARHLPFDRYPFITTSNIVRLLSPLLNSSIQTPLIINTLNIVSLNFFPCGRLNFMLSLHSDSRLMSYFLDTPETSDTYEINTFLITPKQISHEENHSAIPYRLTLIIKPFKRESI